MNDSLAPVGTTLMQPEEENSTALPVKLNAEQRELSSMAEALEPVSTTIEHKGDPIGEHVPEATLVREASAQQTGMDDMFPDKYINLLPKRGEIRRGRVMAINTDSVIVDLGLKREGFIPAEDLQRVGPDIVAKLAVGDEIPVYIVRPEDDKGHILVSWSRARREQDWIDAQRLYETGEIWEGRVRGYNRGGLIVLYGKIRGFVPASHITGISRRMDSASMQARLAEMIGKTIPLKVIEVNRQNRRLIFSERMARREWRAQRREKLLNELQEGDHVHGVVSNVCDFGIFIDIGGTDGLVHISELSWRRTNHPSELLKVGDEVDAYVLHVDKEHKRIGLSLRLMEPDPWEKVEGKYKVGQLVTGMITKVVAFGAFAVLDDGIEGLIHISELAEVAPKHPSEVVSIGMALPLRIVKIDNKRRRMGLSLKRVSEEEWARWEEQRNTEAKDKGQTELGEQAELIAPLEEITSLPSTEETPSFEPPDEILTECPPPEEDDSLQDSLSV